MSTQFLEEWILKALTPQKLRLYLGHQGWVQVQHRNPNILLYKKQDGRVGGKVSIVVPASMTLGDYDRRMIESVRCLASFSGLEPRYLAQQLAYWDRDVLRMRLMTRSGDTSSIPLEMASALIAQLRDFVGFAACAETDPKPFFVKAGGIAKEFAEQCRFGHTFSGSFGLTVESPLPLDPNMQLPHVPSERPFPRAVMERIAIGFVLMEEAVEQDSLDPLIKNYTTGFNANMCEKLTDIIEASSDQRLRYAVIWSPEIDTKPDLVRKQEFTLHRPAYEALTEAAKALHKEDEFEETTIVGKVTVLRSDQPPLHTDEFEFAERAITVQWEPKKKQYVNLRVALPLDEYRQACDAHKNGKRIRITGKPAKEGKFWVLSNEHDFSVVN
ncbi:MAG: hypothetical protein RBT03_02495 [Kiritimatiellia bacterium]|jgi:hypothetical protein|nr:hypothetical protein [Kiritimatiellia bacterium]